MLRFVKQPNETLDYQFDYTQWIPAGDSISSATVTATGLMLGSKTIENGVVVRQFISGGTDGTTYEVTCQITTAQGRVKDSNALIQVQSQ